MLKAYMTKNARRALRVRVASDYLDDITLARYSGALDCVPISPQMYISIYRSYPYPVINIDEYFTYIELMGIDIFKLTEAREESFQVLIAILEAKYGIEYVDAEY